MPEPVSPKVRFAALSLLLAAVFYFGLRYFATSDLAVWALGDATVAIAVMLAAQGVPWKRRLLFAGSTAALSLLLFALVAGSFLGAAATALTESDTQATDPQLAAFVIVQVLFLGVPLAALALFVGRRPSRLWTRE
jgi:hypothetical protein